MNPSRINLAPGTLWNSMLERERSALASGAMRPIETSGEILPDAEVNFIVRKVSSLERKVEARLHEGPPFDPFLPYEQELFVADVSDSHVALLNKFNVLEHHLLVVTRAYAEQASLIDADDLAALAACMREFESLGFYNAGKEAGASQTHKHLQVVRLPLARDGVAVPIEPLLDPVRGARGLCRLPSLPFLHAFSWIKRAWFDDAAVASRELRSIYLAMLDEVELCAIQSEDGVRRCGPYNLLLTRQWMLLVPRLRERFGPVSVSALGFAGSIFVRNEEQLQAVREAGPMNVLAGVAPAPH
jgi:sulfate adenylyltransferase (ADP) / ATP adenylyltransferase